MLEKLVTEEVHVNFNKVYRDLLQKLKQAVKYFHDFNEKIPHEANITITGLVTEAKDLLTKDTCLRIHAHEQFLKRSYVNSMASFTAIQSWGSTFFRLFGWRSVKLNGEIGSVDVTYKRRSKVSEITTMVDYYGTKNV